MQYFLVYTFVNGKLLVERSLSKPSEKKLQDQASHETQKGGVSPNIGGEGGGH